MPTAAPRFAREHVAPRVSASLPDGARPLALVATDGELYGHHPPFRELFLESPTNIPAQDRDFDVVSVGELLADPHRSHLPLMAIRDQTSWSCPHGGLRWRGDVRDAADGRWKRPLRAALDRLPPAGEPRTARGAGGGGGGG